MSKTKNALNKDNPIPITIMTFCSVCCDTIVKTTTDDEEVCNTCKQTKDN